MSKRGTINTREYYGSHNTRDFNKGKSFRYSLEWSPNGHYFNDEFVQDFVSLKGKMYVCLKSNVGIELTDTSYWQFLMEGQKGDKGEIGTLFTPIIDEEGMISWSEDAGLPTPPQMSLKGPQGDKGPRGDSITKLYIGQDGYLYVLMDDRVFPHRAGYVRGDKGDDGREIVLRIDNDANLDIGESGTGTHLQWKYAGDEYKLWTNLIQINELVNIALLGLKLERTEIERTDSDGVVVIYDRLVLSNWKIDFDSDGNVIYIEKINDISVTETPIKTGNLNTIGTYDEIKAIYDAGTLVPGTLYTITDFQTIYTVTDKHQITHILGHDSSQYPSKKYTVVCTAVDKNTLDTSVVILGHPTWVVHYDINHRLVADRGVITYLKDNFNNTADYDFYNRMLYSEELELILFPFSISIDKEDGSEPIIYNALYEDMQVLLPGVEELHIRIVGNSLGASQVCAHLNVRYSSPTPAQRILLWCEENVFSGSNIVEIFQTEDDLFMRDNFIAGDSRIVLHTAQFSRNTIKHTTLVTHALSNVFNSTIHSSYIVSLAPIILVDCNVINTTLPLQQSRISFSRSQITDGDSVANIDIDFINANFRLCGDFGSTLDFSKMIPKHKELIRGAMSEENNLELFTDWKGGPSRHFLKYWDFETLTEQTIQLQWEA